MAGVVLVSLSQTLPEGPQVLSAAIRDLGFAGMGAALLGAHARSGHRPAAYPGCSPSMIDNMNARFETAELVGLEPAAGGRPEAERVCALVASAELAVVEDAGARPAAASLVMFFALAYALSWAWWLPIAVSGGSVRRGDAWPTHLPGLLGP